MFYIAAGVFFWYSYTRLNVESCAETNKSALANTEKLKCQRMQYGDYIQK